MSNLKSKMKTYSFWISLVSAVLIIVRILGEYFGWFINEKLVMDIVTGICGVLVLLGILSSPTKGEETVENTIDQIKKRYNERYDIYVKTADETVDASTDIDGVANTILRSL